MVCKKRLLIKRIASVCLEMTNAEMKSVPVKIWNHNLLNSMMLSINLVSSDMLLKRKCATQSLFAMRLSVLRAALERNVLSNTRQERTHTSKVTKLKSSAQDLITFNKKLKQIKLNVHCSVVKSLN